jgi:hypothetical protein
MKKTTTPTQKEALEAQFLEDTNPHRTCLNHFCVALSYFTSLVALIIGILEVFCFFFLTMTLLENILSFYIILFCLLIIITETNLFNLTKESKILNVWALRGLFYVFVGVLGLNAINTAVMVQGAEFQRTVFQRLVQVFSLVLTGVGLLYVALGLLCVQVINNKMEHRYQGRREKAVQIKSAADTYGSLSHTQPKSQNVV